MRFAFCINTISEPRPSLERYHFFTTIITLNRTGTLTLNGTGILTSNVITIITLNGTWYSHSDRDLPYKSLCIPITLD